MVEEIAIFAAGCFWGVEERFLNQPGVLETQVGYTGGSLNQPTYHDVCQGNTGHAEAVFVRFDPNQISFAKLADLFFGIHDPTTFHRQGPDIGSQYRSAIFFQNSEQEQQAKQALARAQAHWPHSIVTEITPASHFWPAEEYHQKYLRKRGFGSCH